MQDTAILAKLTDIFRDLFDDSSIVLSPDLTADDVEGWDSTNHITLIVETERQFGVKFQTAEIEDLKNVGEFVHAIAGKLLKTTT
jgi:acyl carrier protein